MVLKPGVLDAILADATDVFVQVPKRGAETGGILLGRSGDEGILIEDSVPVRSEHRFGRLYRLSETDRQNLRDSLDAARARTDGLKVAGFYRSDARGELVASEEDAAFLAEHFPEEERRLLLVRPSLSGESQVSFAFWRNGRMETLLDPEPLPFEADEEPQKIVEMEPSKPRLTLVAATLQMPPATPAFSEAPAGCPAPRLALVTPKSEPAPLLLADGAPVAPARRLAWTVAGAVVAAALVAGYYYSRRPTPPELIVAVVPPAPAPESPASRAPAPEPPAPTAPAAGSRDREMSTPRVPVQDVVNRWAEAIRKGQIETAANFYIPSSRDAAKSAIRQTLGPAARMDIFRLSDTAISYPAPSQAVAIFRQRWQSGGVRKTAGEQRVRMVLQEIPDGWQIVSAQPEEVYWTQTAQ